MSDTFFTSERLEELNRRILAQRGYPENKSSECLDGPGNSSPDGSEVQHGRESQHEDQKEFRNLTYRTNNSVVRVLGDKVIKSIVTPDYFPYNEINIGSKFIHKSGLIPITVYIDHTDIVTVESKYAGRTLIDFLCDHQSINCWDLLTQKRIIYNLFHTMHFLHSNGILHLDLTISNILIDDSQVSGPSPHPSGSPPHPSGSGPSGDSSGVGPSGNSFGTGPDTQPGSPGDPSGDGLKPFRYPFGDGRLNLLRYPKCKIIDFGAAQVMDMKTQTFSHKHRMSSFYVEAPELSPEYKQWKKLLQCAKTVTKKKIFNGDLSDFNDASDDNVYTPKCDVWGLGITLLMCYTAALNASIAEHNSNNFFYTIYTLLHVDKDLFFKDLDDVDPGIKKMLHSMLNFDQPELRPSFETLMNLPLFDDIRQGEGVNLELENGWCECYIPKFISRTTPLESSLVRNSVMRIIDIVKSNNILKVKPVKHLFRAIDLFYRCCYSHNVQMKKDDVQYLIPNCIHLAFREYGRIDKRSVYNTTVDLLFPLVPPVASSIPSPGSGSHVSSGCVGGTSSGSSNSSSSSSSNIPGNIRRGSGSLYDKCKGSPRMEQRVGYFRHSQDVKNKLTDMRRKSIMYTNLILKQVNGILDRTYSFEHCSTLAQLQYSFEKVFEPGEYMDVLLDELNEELELNCEHCTQTDVQNITCEEFLKSIENKVNPGIVLSVSR